MPRSSLGRLYNRISRTAKFIRVLRSPCFRHTTERVDPFHNELTVLSEVRTRAKQPDSTITWVDALYLSQGTNFSEPLDRGFGVMCLVHRDVQFEADYTLTIQQQAAEILRQEAKFRESRAHQYLWPALWMLLLMMDSSFGCNLRQHISHLINHKHPDLGLLRVDAISSILHALELCRPSWVPQQTKDLVWPFDPSKYQTPLQVDEFCSPRRELHQFLGKV